MQNIFKTKAAPHNIKTNVICLTRTTNCKYKRAFYPNILAFVTKLYDHDQIDLSFLIFPRYVLTSLYMEFTDIRHRRTYAASKSGTGIENESEIIKMTFVLNSSTIRHIVTKSWNGHRLASTMFPTSGPEFRVCHFLLDPFAMEWDVSEYLCLSKLYQIFIGWCCSMSWVDHSHQNILIRTSVLVHQRATTISL